MKRTYIPAPNCDYPPGGSIALGRILTDPFDPGTCLNPDGPLPFPQNMPKQLHTKEDWKHEKQRSHGGLIGLWAKFLQFIGVTVEANVGWSSSKGDVYEFDELFTEFIDPTPEYIENSVLDLPVAKHIIDSAFKDPVYMITGVKIAKGAAVAIGRSRELSGNIRAGVDATSTGTPASGGPEASVNSKRQEDFGFRSSSEFVFAYRLREIYYDKAIKVQHKAVKGSLYDLDALGKSAEEDRQILESVLKVGDMADESDTVKSLNVKTEEAFDDVDDEKCDFVPEILTREST